METCRFLSKKGVCQIAQLGLHNLEHEDSTLAVLTGDTDKPSKANMNPGIVTDIDTGREVRIFVMECTVENDVPTQQSCDGFLPKKKPTRTEWLENFSEG